MKIKNSCQNWVKWVLPVYLFTFLPLALQAEDGHQLWLRYQPVNKAKITGPACIAVEELKAYSTQDVTLKLDASMEEDAYNITPAVAEPVEAPATITAKNEIGLLYGAYALLRGETTGSKPFYKLRILNHWDNLNGTIERGYAGLSIFM